MKTKTISLRIKEKDRARWGKAAREYKNLSAFFLHMVSDAFQYRALIEQVKSLETLGVKKEVLINHAKKLEWQEKQRRREA